MFEKPPARDGLPVQSDLRRANMKEKIFPGSPVQKTQWAAVIKGCDRNIVD